MIDLVLATGNPDKVRELSHALAGLPMAVHAQAELGEWPEVEETGATLEANALLKAGTAAERTGLLCLADDTGLEVDALNGAPGVRSGRYAGEKATYTQNVDRLLAEMRRVPADRRTARFRCVIAIVEPGGRVQLVEGVSEGEILCERRGDGGFGYDPVFLVQGFGKTFAEMSLAEKQACSHRGRALAKARDLLREWYGAA